jgi:hypothetical protein
MGISDERALRQSEEVAKIASGSRPSTPRWLQLDAGASSTPGFAVGNRRWKMAPPVSAF